MSLLPSPTKAAKQAANLPDPSLPPAPSSDDHFTAQDLINRQAQLERDAREAIPFQLGKCTYLMGSIRQPVYACRDCGGGGICSGCSVECHGEHQLIELFNKRNFTCDCGTRSLCRDPAGPSEPPPCNLRESKFDVENEGNLYGKNFKGVFCYCERGKTYNSEEEEETMFQCIACEDWLHESCVSLRPSKPIKPLSSELTSKEDSKSKDPIDLSDQAPPLIDHEKFDYLLCDSCVRKPGNEVLRSYFGSNGWAGCLEKEIGLKQLQDPPDTSNMEWDGVEVLALCYKTSLKEEAVAEEYLIFGMGKEEIEDGTADEILPATSTSSIQMGEKSSMDSSSILKRPAGEETEFTQEAKRPRLESNAESSTLTTVINTASCKRPKALAIALDASKSDPPPGSTTSSPIKIKSASTNQRGEVLQETRLDIYLSENFRDRICRCEECLPLFASLPFLLAEEETYVPPLSRSGTPSNDGASTAGSSTYDLGMAALSKLPREKAIESLRAYEQMRDDLFGHLRQFATSGEAVSKEDIKNFFEKKKREQGGN